MSNLTDDLPPKLELGSPNEKFDFWPRPYISYFGKNDLQCDVIMHFWEK